MDIVSNGEKPVYFKRIKKEKIDVTSKTLGTFYTTDPDLDCIFYN